MSAPDDTPTFEVIAATRLAWLRRTAYALSRDRHLADDLAQAALIKLYVAWPLRDIAGVDGWLRTTLLHTYLDERRRPRWRHERTVCELPDQLVQPDPGGLDGALAAALGALPRQQRACLVLRFLEDCSVEETAALVGCRTGTVKSHTSRGLAALRATLEPAPIGGRP